ncbi:uncharacterized protein LOC126681477 [Mercurialis annua]|uniref:uncharacterized protein LOC126681477 n=1 Tax=Mercurialis annua TaxID=3986 RepID=UPI002160AB63|nr:uncharacterized protein LOC126681477 [Mercurialis annua]
MYTLVSANSLNDYRPIACCNVILKCITKIISTRLSSCVGSIIDKSQCAFIPGRRITDNVLLAHELVYDYHNDSGPSSCAMKVDLRKAYDSIEWDFLEEMLLNLNFPRRFIHWVMRSVRTPTYSVAINGSLFDNTSVSYMKEALLHLQSVSGLKVNNEKSSIFFSNVSAHNRVNFLNIMDFAEGKLPVKYLGMPLISRRLTKTDSQVLIQRVTSRISSWNFKFLSFAGSMGESWDTICTYKKGGGLGVKKVELWNKAAIMKQIWFLLTDKCSLWSHWVILKRLSYWGITKPYKASWSWRNLVKLREMAKEIFECKIGNGEDTLFWYDPWVNGNSIIDLYPVINITDADIPKTAKVADVYRNGTWYFPDAMDEQTLQAWDTGSSVSWAKLIWKAHIVPRHSFITWMVIQRGLKTRDKLFRWGTVDNPNCSLCNCCVETINHLFFSCIFSSEVWKKVLFACAINRPPLVWNREISWFTRKYGGKNTSTKIRRLAFCSTVYHIWLERNNTIFSGSRPDVNIVSKRISFSVLSKSHSRLDGAISDCWL